MTALDQSARECDCLPDVIRCAHLGETVVALFADPSSRFFRYVVSVFPASWPRTASGKDYVLVIDPNTLWIAMHPYAGDSEADALAAFYAAEEAFLRGEA